ncbi:hypothetical protein [Yersinia kristensenii]|uniref:Lipoprotein n=2 Tax=Yersinia kristensenii TaxID=28152 RepID=A0AB73NL88_YERKR|nr:hypothetical protein [Yersinia kristensenii]MDA5475652.1 hypothetical protein [Yersinia kristensenii]MDA5508122.1 hypothetical protein [Yersinia kristensenii]MDA5523370.1 hypothetical protein [Yersinia kristensenii]MDX6735753.1 hypothetical protein [Yersinia kristensenii]NIK96089.1 hypothetical protein [Yersinia kristensenii]
MKISIIAATVVFSAILSGCAVQNDKTQFHGIGLTYQADVKKLDNGDYFTEVEAAPAAGRIKGAIGTANKKASDFCRAQNKAMKEVKTDIDTHLLVNGVARLTFQCV